MAGSVRTFAARVLPKVVEEIKPVASSIAPVAVARASDTAVAPRMATSRLSAGSEADTCGSAEGRDVADSAGAAAVPVKARS